MTISYAAAMTALNSGSTISRSSWTNKRTLKLSLTDPDLLEIGALNLTYAVGTNTAPKSITESLEDEVSDWFIV